MCCPQEQDFAYDRAALHKFTLSLSQTNLFDFTAELFYIPISKVLGASYLSFVSRLHLLW